MTRSATGLVNGTIHLAANAMLAVAPLLAAGVVAIGPESTAALGSTAAATGTPQAATTGDVLVAPLMVTAAIAQGVDVGGVQWKVHVGSSNVKFSWLFRF